MLRLRTQAELGEWRSLGEGAKRNVGEDLLASQFRLYRLPPFEQHHKFALSEGRKFEFDYAFLDYRIYVEIEGLVPERVTILRKDGTRETRLIVGGRHASIDGMIRDMEKYNLASKLGWYQVRVPQKWVKENKAIAVVIDVLTAHGWKMP